MAAMKPRTGDGPMEAVKEGRLIIVRVPLEGGGRLVVSVNDAEAKELHDALAGVVAPVWSTTVYTRLRRASPSGGARFFVLGCGCVQPRRASVGELGELEQAVTDG
jgi:Protein of unknown function (DUF3117)